jgi:ribonuclease PH
VEDSVPDFLEGSGKGWITAEYAMLPRSTGNRMSRGASGRWYEIQRLIGRSLRSIADLRHLDQHTVRIDCDVLQADGGTRTAAVTGAYVALCDAITRLMLGGAVSTYPLADHVAATSVGVLDGIPSLDLCYEEDARAEVDLNIVATRSGKIIEIQGTAEKEPFDKETLDELIELGLGGIRHLIDLQIGVLSKSTEGEAQ